MAGRCDDKDRLSMFELGNISEWHDNNAAGGGKVNETEKET